jgi:hypothetical protein
MLPRGFVDDYFARDPADGSGGEEGSSKRFSGRERIGNLENARFGAVAIRFGGFDFFCVLVYLRCSREDLPGCEQNFKSINN